MAAPAATILVPTHDHGPLLTLAVRSALQQTVADVEVVVVGDGVDDATRAAAVALDAEDPRVRFLDRPKAPRHGEILRPEAIALTTAPAILYLGDDDVWLPEHVAHMLELLEGHDVANALSLWIGPTGIVQHTTLDLAMPFHRDAVLAGDQTPTLTAMGHTRALYERLPHGWRTTPAGIATDSWMWRQLLADPATTARSGFLPTIVHLPSPQRRDMDDAARVAELERYAALIHDPAWCRRLAEDTLDGALREAAWFWASRETLRGDLERVTAERDRLAVARDRVFAELVVASTDRARIYEEFDRLREEVLALRAEVAVLRYERGRSA